MHKNWSFQQKMVFLRKKEFNPKGQGHPGEFGEKLFRRDLGKFEGI